MLHIHSNGCMEKKKITMDQWYIETICWKYEHIAFDFDV